MLSAMRLASRKAGFPVGLVLGLAGAVAAIAVTALHLDRLGFSVCAFKRLTGLPCATCGSTRALAYLAHLDVGGAFSMNPLAVLLVVLVAAWCFADVILLLRGRVLSLDLSAGELRLVQISLLVALAGNWAYLVAVGR